MSGRKETKNQFWCGAAAAAAVVLAFFFLIRPSGASAELVLPATDCDDEQVEAIMPGFGISAHITSGMTREDGTRAFTYGADNNSFAEAVEGLTVLHINLLFDPAGNAGSVIKLLAFSESCTLVFGFGPISGTDGDVPLQAGANTVSYNPSSNEVVFNSGIALQNVPNFPIRYIWAEVWDGQTGADKKASYSYLVDVSDLQNPTEEEVEEEESEEEAEEEEEEESPSESSGGGGYYPIPEIIRFEASSLAVKEGEETTLSWEAANSGDVTLHPVGLVSPSGSITVHPQADTEYILTASSPNGSVSARLSIKFKPRDPVVIVPGILGSFNGKLDPILHTYRGLWNGLKSVGYIENQTLFAFPYNWRQDNRETARLFAEKVNEILRICGCEKVDVVAHSMGGLVARYYTQNINGSAIDQLIFLGTPHLGAPKAYLAWEAGEMGPELSDELAETIFSISAHASGYFNNIPKYIHDHIVSVKQLLPTYRYLMNFESGEFYGYEKCRDGLFECNEFLEHLNSIDLENYKIRFYNLISDDFNTFRSFTISRLIKSPHPEPNKWKHGRPVNYPKLDGILQSAGDGTVPKHSAEWGSEKIIKIIGAHRYLPYLSQSEISKILIGKEMNGLLGPLPYRKILFIRLGSPANISITDPNGNSFGAGFGDDGNAFYSGPEGPEFITIPDPADGEYEITVIGTGTGEFTVETSLLGDDLKISRTFQGAITPGEKYEFDFSYFSETNEISELTLQDLKAPETEIAITGTESRKTIILQAVDESQVIETLYSLDSGQNWMDYESELVFEHPGDYQILYRSIDEHGNQEHAKITTFSVFERVVNRQNEIGTTVSPPPLEEGGEEGVSDDETFQGQPTSTGEVLGITTKAPSQNEKQRNNIFFAAAGLLAVLLIIYLRKQKV